MYFSLHTTHRQHFIWFRICICMFIYKYIFCDIFASWNFSLFWNGTNSCVRLIGVQFFRAFSLCVGKIYKWTEPKRTTNNQRTICICKNWTDQIHTHTHKCTFCSCACAFHSQARILSWRHTKATHCHYMHEQHSAHTFKEKIVATNESLSLLFALITNITKKSSRLHANKLKLEFVQSPLVSSLFLSFPLYPRSLFLSLFLSQLLSAQFSWSRFIFIRMWFYIFD